MLPGKVPYRNFYFVALLALSGKRLLIRFSFSNYNNREWLLIATFLAPVTLLPKVPVISLLHEESTKKPVQIIVENAFSLFKSSNITVTILAVIDTS